MSGTVVRSIEHLASAAAANDHQEVFVNLYKWLQLHVAAGNAVLHASNYGSSGTGFDFHDQSNPAGENAWAVFRFLATASTVRTVDMYVLIQWAHTSLFGAAPGSPANLEATTGDGVGIVMAFREGGGDPWNGSTGSPGSDTKGTPVWTGGDLHVLDRSMSNPAGGAGAGAFVTNLENMQQVVNLTTAGGSSRYHFIGDADTLMWLCDNADAAGYIHLGILGAYQELPTLNAPYPFFSLVASTSTTNPAVTNVFGTVAGSGALLGGVLGRDNTKGVGQCSTTYLDSVIDSLAHQPNRQYLPNGASLFDAVPLWMVDSEGNNPGLVGAVDQNIASVVYGPAGEDTNPGLTRAYLGGATASATAKFAVNWDGATTPNSGGTRAGVQS